MVVNQKNITKIKASTRALTDKHTNASSYYNIPSQHVLTKHDEVDRKQVHNLKITNMNKISHKLLLLCFIQTSQIYIRQEDQVTNVTWRDVDFWTSKWHSLINFYLGGVLAPLTCQEKKTFQERTIFIEKIPFYRENPFLLRKSIFIKNGIILRLEYLIKATTNQCCGYLSCYWWPPFSIKLFAQLVLKNRGNFEWGRCWLECTPSIY